MSDLQRHWETIFTRKLPTEVSWYTPRLAISLQLIATAGIAKTAAIIDAGGGDSTLVDDLLNLGYTNVTVLDISAVALERSKARLGERASAVRWLNADITRTTLQPNSFDLWHDRAMFHFLTDSVLRASYIRLCMSAIKPGGALIIATFGPDGPEQCSGLPTMRYSASDLEKQFAPAFHTVESIPELHMTPAGRVQSFVHCLLRKQ